MAGRTENVFWGSGELLMLMIVALVLNIWLVELTASPTLFVIFLFSLL